MTAEPTDLDAVAERLDASAAYLEGYPPNDLARDSAADHRIAAKCIRLVAAIREPSEAMVEVVDRALTKAAAAPWWTNFARAALRAIAERGAG